LRIARTGEPSPVRLIVPPGVFRPPSDARLLAEVVREHARGRDVLDVGTGSGVLAVCAALAGARTTTAVDVSRRALLAARLNGILNGVSIRVVRSDLLAGVARRYDVIASNPPYLPAADAGAPRGLERATEAGPDGRLHVDRLIAQAPGRLRPGGVLLLVHSSVNGVSATLGRLAEAGLAGEVLRRRRGPLGPVLSARAELLERRGLLAPGCREEEVVVVRGRLAPASRSRRCAA
jgi:release factor glutamine methyltransferase